MSEATRSSRDRVVAIVQARVGSKRFPGKSLLRVESRSLLGFMLSRVKKSKTVDSVVLAIPDGSDDDALVSVAEEFGVAVHRGPELDVLGRFWGAAVSNSADVVVRLTGDCPLIDWTVIDSCVRPVLSGEVDHSKTSEGFPDGLDTEVFRVALLNDAHQIATEEYDREHVTPWIRRVEGLETRLIEPDAPLLDIRLTLDEPEDFSVIESVIDAFGRDDFLATEIDELACQNPGLFEANRHLSRNEGAAMSSGEKMWRRAQRVVAGGNMLLSKRPDQYSNGLWPSYFSRAKGCSVWDLDGRELIDVGYMGVGTNILGYGHDPVDRAVKQIVDAGNLSTLNAPEEIILAERLCEIHPWADMARFTRSGGEAGAVAVRLARASTGREKVVFCGYHGWHDWYLSANLNDLGALDGHLLPGLNSAGVPRGLAGSAEPFEYNNIESLREAASGDDVAAIIMEVERSTPPLPGFLEGVRELATSIGAVLIFDECTSGFRRNLGGHHLHYGVNPDLAIFGKTLGNGYAINAIIGIQEVMTAAEKTFISSTFWTERIGPTAALATIEEMVRLDAPASVHEFGLQVRDIWTSVCADLRLPVAFRGLPSLTSFHIEGIDAKVLKTLLVELFLPHGYLAGPAFYASLAHEVVLDGPYCEVLHEVLSPLARHYNEGSLDDLLPRGLARAGFGRLV